MIRIALALAALAAPACAPAAGFRTPAAARAVITGYYRAIARGDFRAAYAAWSDGGRASGKTLAGFRRGFAATAHSRVVAGAPTDREGGAGSVFITVPVEVYATLKTGRRQHFRGSYALRRVNQGIGGTAQQQHWHIASADLRVVR